MSLTGGLPNGLTLTCSLCGTSPFRSIVEDAIEMFVQVKHTLVQRPKQNCWSETGEEDLLLSYSDILYTQEVLKAVAQSNYQFGILVVREEHPKSSRRVVWNEAGEVVAFGADGCTQTKTGHFVGLFKIAAQARTKIKAFLSTYTDFQTQFKMTKFLTALLENKVLPIHAIEIDAELEKSIKYFHKTSDLVWHEEGNEATVDFVVPPPASHELIIPEALATTSSRPRQVLVSQRLLETKEYVEDREALDTRWGNFFSALGVVPVPTLTAVDPDLYFAACKPAGIFLSGGNNLFSCGGDRLSLQRDEFERKLVHKAIAEGVPIFAVCRGTQLVAEMFGLELKKMPGHVARNHDIKINALCAESEILTKIPSPNSFHGFCIVSDLDEMKFDTMTVRVCARCVEDNTVEAFSVPEAKIFCIMWHPERLDPFHPYDMHLITKHFGLDTL